MNSLTVPAPHAPSIDRRQAVLHVVLLTGLCAALVSLTLPWMSREVSATVRQVERLQVQPAPFAPVPNQTPVHVFAGINAR